MVFYNGIDETPEESILKLSDSYIKPDKGEPDVEIRVRMLNVNYGKNLNIMNACKPLCDYAWFIDTIRKYQAMYYPLDEAVDKTLAEATEDFVLKSFLEENMAEVKGMLDTEFDLDEFRELFMADAQREIDRIEAQAAKDREQYEEEKRKLNEEIERLRAQIPQ